jgi:fumarate reductase subunit D
MKHVRNHPAYWAFLVHRISGIALALFLPAHFLALGTAIRGEAALDEFLRWTEQPLVIAAEWVLVILLAAHMAGGLRVLALEFLPWRGMAEVARRRRRILRDPCRARIRLRALRGIL